MKILTWNLQRLEKANQKIIFDKLAEFDADIIILTETNSAINLGEKYFSASTETLSAYQDGIKYKPGENRVTIYSKFKIKSKIKTYNEFTSVCVVLETDFGLLNVYGTIIGIFGGQKPPFKTDLESQLLDLENLNRENSICVAGDFNIMFSGFAYPSHNSRNKMNSIFERLNLKNLTSEIENNVDHIVLSREFLSKKNCKTEIWNEDKKLSDHIGICLSIK